METTEAPGIIFSASSGAIFTLNEVPVEVDNFSDTQVKNEIKVAPWAPWTTSNTVNSNMNRKGIDMATQVKKCGVLRASIEAKARICIGKGIRPVQVTGVDKDGEDIIEYVDDPDINAWLEANNIFTQSIAAVRNVIGYGWTHGRFVLSNDATIIAKYKTDDVVNCRLGRKDVNTGLIKQTFIAADWRQVVGDDDPAWVKPIELLEEDNELNDLNQRIIENKSEVREFSIIGRGPLHGNIYYPPSMWESSSDWVDFAIQVPGMKKAMMNNQMSIKYIITIGEKYFSRGDSKWNEYTADQKQEKFRAKANEINTYLSGNDKAYKSIVTGSYFDPATQKEIKDIQIEVIDDKIKDGKLLPDSGAADKQILFSLMMNPAIMGANTGGDYSGGAGSGSDIREAYLVQIMLMEAERHLNYKVFNVVKHFNKWVDKYPNLQFRYPNTILTTLDTGGSTAPVN